MDGSHLTPSAALLGDLPSGFTKEDAKLAEEYLHTDLSTKGSESKCFIVVKFDNGKTSCSSVHASGASETQPIQKNLKRANSGKNENLANSDAERKALSEMIYICKGWAKGTIANGDTLYVFGSRGPCRCCKEVVRKFAADNSFRVVFLYAAKDKTEANGTVGGMNGYEAAEKWSRWWVCVPSAVAEKTKTSEEGKKTEDPPLWAMNAVKMWKKNKEQNANELKSIKKTMRPQVLNWARTTGDLDLTEEDISELEVLLA